MAKKSSAIKSWNVTTGGVTKTPSNRFRARITVNGKRVQVGNFTTKKAAMAALEFARSNPSALLS